MTKLTQAVAVAMLALLLIRSPPAQADGVVTECTAQALLDALVDGGNVSFQLDEDCEITLSDAITIGANGFNHVTSLISDGPNKLTIKGDGTARLFNVEGDATLELFNIAIANGRDTNGGAIYVQNGATLFASNCVFSGNSAVGN